MAKTIRTFVSDGTRTLYPVSFDLGYARKEFVYVYQGDLADYENQLSYVWTSDSEIELSSPVPSGQEFYIRRIVPRNEAFNDYSDGAILREKNLDNSFAQALMIWEELSDGFYSVDGESTFNFNLDMGGNSITNVEVDESDNTSVITKGYGDSRFVNITGDTLVGTLGGIDATASTHFMPRLQISNLIDSRMTTAPGKDPALFEDLGLSSTTVGITADYGNVVDLVDETEDYGSI